MQLTAGAHVVHPFSWHSANNLPVTYINSVQFGAFTFLSPTLSTVLPRPVDPNVSIAKYSPSSIFVSSSFLTNITDFPP